MTKEDMLGVINDMMADIILKTYSDPIHAKDWEQLRNDLIKVEEGIRKCDAAGDEADSSPEAEKHEPSFEVRPYREGDLPQRVDIWNEVVDGGAEFPDETRLGNLSGRKFFSSQTVAAVAVDDYDGTVAGLYILHPNNIGRCGHLCNASFAVRSGFRGQHIGETLVKDCLEQAPKYGFRVLMFNAVVEDNAPAIHLYEKLGFVSLGTVPGGFRTSGGRYKDILLFYHTL